MLGTAACFLAVMAIGYLLGTTYLVLRDDLIGATMARQARIQHAYEDRIASLRSQVDRITSRQLLDQQIMDDKMTRLMEQQAMLSTRHGRLDSLLKRADVVELVPTTIPIPQARPEIGAPVGWTSSGPPQRGHDRRPWKSRPNRQKPMKHKQLSLPLPPPPHLEQKMFSTMFCFHCRKSNRNNSPKFRN